MRLYREAFAGLPREVWWLCGVTFVHRSGTMVLPFLTLYLTGPVGLAPEWGGVGLAVFGVGSLAGTWLGGTLTDRFGSTAVQAVSLAAAGVGFVVLGWLATPAALFAGLFLVALLVDAFRPANSVALAERVGSAERGRAFALRRLAINLGMTFGPVVGGFLARVDYLWLFLADGGTCLAAVVLLLVLFRGAPNAVPEEIPAREGDPAAAAEGERARRGPWRDRPYLVFVLLTGLLSAVLFQFLSTFPLTLRDGYGMTEDRIGLVFAVNTLLIIAFEMVLIHRLARVARLRLVAWGALLIGAGYGLTPFGDTFLFAALVMVVITVGEMLGLPSAEAHAADAAPAGARGRYLGLFNLSFAAALTAGPAAGTWVYGHLGAPALWAGCAAAGVALWLAFTALSRRQGETG